MPSSSVLSSLKISFDRASTEASCRIALLSVKFVIVSSSLSCSCVVRDFDVDERRAIYFGWTCRCTNGIFSDTNYFSLTYFFCNSFSALVPLDNYLLILITHKILLLVVYFSPSCIYSSTGGIHFFLILFIHFYFAALFLRHSIKTFWASEKIWHSRARSQGRN